MMEPQMVLLSGTGDNAVNVNWKEVRHKDARAIHLIQIPKSTHKLCVP